MVPLTVLVLLGTLLSLCPAVQAGLTAEQAIQILDVFNLARNSTVVPAANMRILSWDPNLAAEAQNFTNTCIQKWQSFPDGWIAYWDQGYDPVGVAEWRTLRMAPYFDYQTGGCINTVASNKTCRHPENYEALTLATIDRVGCG
jgi:hypothetical protein